MEANFRCGRDTLVFKCLLQVWCFLENIYKNVSSANIGNRASEPPIFEKLVRKYNFNAGTLCDLHFMSFFFFF
jgi:hypothetical protein